MATRIGNFKIWLKSFDSLTRKPLVRRIDLGYIFYTSRVVADFVSNFVAMAAGVGHPGENLNDVVKLAIPENHTLESKITILSCVQPEL